MASVTLYGDIDIYAMPSVDEQFAALDGEHVVIDLRSVRLVSAPFFGAVARLRRRLPESRIEVVGANPRVRELFRLVRVDSIVVLR